MFVYVKNSNMRTYKELLQLVLDHYENEDDLLGSTFICYNILCLYSSMTLTYDEFEKLDNYILSKRPKRGKFYDKNYKDSLAFWNRDNIEIRIEWLKHLISKL